MTFKRKKIKQHKDLLEDQQYRPQVVPVRKERAKLEREWREGMKYFDPYAEEDDDNTSSES